MSPWHVNPDGTRRFRGIRDRAFEPSSIMESFRWTQGLDSFKTLDAGPNTIKIKGKALTSGTVSLNHRKYIDSEILRAARTLIGKPITCNHQPDQIVGNVDWAEYENGALEYLATIKKQPYVDLLRNKSTDIKGVSVEASMLYSECTICHRKFETDKAWRDHMVNEEMVKDLPSEPHGINFQALSLVLAPQVPGVQDTTIELAETALGLERLFEMVIQRGEKMDGKVEENILISKSGFEKPRKTIETIAKEYGLNLQRLGEPFAQYSSFTACVNQNQDKDDPEGFCATIMRATEERVTDEAVRKELKLATESMSRVETELDGLAERYNTTGLAINKWKQEIDRKVSEALNLISKGTTEIAALKESIPERKEMLKLIETQQITLENTRDKLKGTFKGNQKDVSGQSPCYSDPMKEHPVNPITGKK
jgi:hypothetical protein